MKMAGGTVTLSNYPKSKAFSPPITSRLRRNPNHHHLNLNLTQKKKIQKIQKESKKKELTGSKTN
jgi:hypothetical protein